VKSKGDGGERRKNAKRSQTMVVPHERIGARGGNGDALRSKVKSKHQVERVMSGEGGRKRKKHKGEHKSWEKKRGGGGAE